MCNNIQAKANNKTNDTQKHTFDKQLPVQSENGKQHDRETNDTNDVDVVCKLKMQTSY